MKKLFCSLLVMLSMMSHAQTQQVVVGDMNDDGKLTVHDVASLVSTVAGKTAQRTLTVGADPYLSDNSKVAGTWRTQSGTEITFSADGKCSLGTGYTYEYHPFQGIILINDASGKLTKVYNLYRAESSYLILGEVGGTKAFDYYFTGASFVSTITMSQSTATMNSGSTLQLSATVSPSDAHDGSLTWKSSSTSLATVDQTGKVTAKAGGTVTITATANDGSGKSASCKITIVQLVTKVALNYTTLTVGKGNTFNLDATVTPTNASNKELTWTSSNTSAVMVLDDGVFYAKAAGTSTLTAKAKDAGGKSATCKVTVLSAAPTAITLSKTSVSIKPGETAQLTATVSPSGASGATVIWTSSNTSVATVDQTGKVTAKADSGTATITATVAGSTSIVASATVKIASHEYVEIGGKKWSTMNLGATTVAGSYATCAGDFYAWGETTPRYTGISWSGSDVSLSGWKSGFSSGYDTFASYTCTTLDAAHDAVTSHPDWGESWRTPTVDDFKALYAACGGTGSYIISTTLPSGSKSTTAKGIYRCNDYDGVAGLLFCDGTNKLFFPAVGGIVNFTSHAYGGSCAWYLSSSLYTSNTSYAYNLGFNLDSSSVYPSNYFSLYGGFAIRPLSD